MTAATAPPAGTIAMLFTDVEGSTAFAVRLGPGWGEVLASHHRIVGGAIERAGGWVEGTEGDAFFATFADPRAAASAAIDAQRALAAHPWPGDVGSLRVRMGLHVGYVERRDTGYVGLEVHRAARVCAAAHGGQLLLTAAAREVVGEALTLEFLGAHRLKDFPAPVQLYCAVIDGRGAGAFPPPRTHDARPTNLPAGLPTLVGRDHELGQIRESVLNEGERMISLTGRGGSGKTSLALVAGAGLLDEHPGGVWWVDLTAVTDPSAVIDAVATAVGADREVRAGTLEAVTGRLAGIGPTLLILDNMEQLTAAGADLEHLLAALPELRVLVTTQVPLRSANEFILALDALDDEPALALIERVARRRGARPAAGARDREPLIEIVRLLDGLPLALELAAARLALLSPAQLRDRLASSLELLKDASSSRPERQRSLQATVDWTLGLLDDEPRRLFTRLGVFAAPVELQEIELIAGGDGLDVLEALSVLRDVALVRRVESGDGRIRFGLPEALRQLAAARLDEAPDAERWRRAHAERQGELMSVGLEGTTNQTDRATAAADVEAARALSWAARHDSALAQALAARRAMHLGNLGRLRDAQNLLAPLLSDPPADRKTRVEALSAATLLSVVTNQVDDAIAYSEEAVELADTRSTRVEAVMARAGAYAAARRIDEAVRDNRSAVEWAGEQGPANVAGALMMLVQTLIMAGRLGEAAERLEEAARVGLAADASMMRYLDTQEADLAMARGRPEDAVEPYARSLEGAAARGDVFQVLFDLRGMANALGALERDEDTIEVLGLAEALSVELGGDAGTLGLHTLGDEPVQAALQRLGGDRAQAARDRGRAVAPGLRVARACQLGRAVLSPR
ncbi:MAG TPA: AAA family ATPase [Solirubrobacteraceae bacterium]|jgi:predicted ATPase/class 3 adenylate cyclase